MLTKLESRISDLIYSAAGQFVYMPFGWNHDKMFPKPISRQKRVYNLLMCSIVLTLATSRARSLSGLVRKRNINSSIFETIFVARYIFHFIFRINIWIFQQELVQLINHSIAVNRVWGKV